MTTRADFFDRIRARMREAGARAPAKTADRPQDAREAAEIVRRQLAERWPATLERFRREFERVGGAFHRVPTGADLPDVVARIARERGVSRLVAWHPSAVRADLAPALAPLGLDVDVVPPGPPADEERRLLRAASAEAGVGITGTDLAIAETGTLVLRSGPGRPRSTSLLPATHVAVFDRTALIESLGQLGVFLEAWHVHAPVSQAGPPVRRQGGSPRPRDGDWGAMVMLITGPSRTADIELTLTRGVHGPKEVHAVFVEEGLGG
jgi:L-lactate dehydrogenase complex protein LldG